MKKKFCITLFLIILVISEISIVYADVIMPGESFHSYSGSMKFEKFMEYLVSPFKEALTLLLILFIIIGLVLLTFRCVNNKKQNSNEEKSNSMTLLQKIYFGLNIILNLTLIQMIKVIMLFEINNRNYIRENSTNRFMIHIYAIYAIIMFVISLISLKKKNKKIIYITAICITIILLIICFITYNNINAGYYTSDIYPYIYY